MNDVSVTHVVVFGAILAGSTVGLDYHLYTQQNAALDSMGATPHGSYIDSLSQRIGARVETAGTALCPPAMT